jgi:hypothetical protein
MQFQDNIDQDQGKADFLRMQIRDVNKKIDDSRSGIKLMEDGLKDFRVLQEQLLVKEKERQMLIDQKDRQYENLHEEIEGQFPTRM